MFPVTSAVEFKTPSKNIVGGVKWVLCNRERTIAAALWSNALVLYCSHPRVPLCCHMRSSNDVFVRGENQRLLWKPDSSAVLVSSKTRYLFFYNVMAEVDSELYRFSDARDTPRQKKYIELIVQQRIPKVVLSSSTVIQMSSPAISFVSLKEELFVALQDGWIHRLLWDGQILEEFSMSVGRLPILNTSVRSRPNCLSTVLGGDDRGPSIAFSDMRYSPLIGGFVVVLTDGRAGLMVAASPRFDPSELRVVLAPDLTDACCCCANHKYRLLCFGCLSSDVCVYHIDDQTGALVRTYRVRVNQLELPEVMRHPTPVRYVEWSPCESALVVAWHGGGFGGWSVFGRKLWFRLATEVSRESEDHRSSSSTCTRVCNFDWGPEGYELWLCCDEKLRVQELLHPSCTDKVLQADMERVALVASDRIYISPVKSFENRQLSTSHSYWQQMLVPHEYIGLYWPIRYVHYDSTQQSLCVAGTRGLTYYNFEQNKWRLFGNESQERSFVVTGGLCCWRENVILACYDIENECDQIRCYSQRHSLSDTFCTRVSVDVPSLLMSVCHDVLVTFDLDARCCLFSLGDAADGKASGPILALTLCSQISLRDYVFHPFCVVAIFPLSRLTDGGLNKGSAFADTLMVNVSGHLLMLSLSSPSENLGGVRSSDRSQLEPPLLVASFVEGIWSCCSGSRATLEPLSSVEAANENAVVGNAYFSHAIWMHCGHRGMLVWMPLFPLHDGRAVCQGNPSFISKWVMLPFEISVYPLSVSSRECFVSGIESDFGADEIRYSTDLQSQVFLHHILKQLIKRNLGNYALEIARSYDNLPYFPHLLELLLHTVLEEEATSSEPIPDPLLPSIVAFLKEFKEFLRTVAHCARKTEMALWKHLFQIVGRPKDLYNYCLENKELDTATSYFIILQSTESAADTKELATSLLKTALSCRRWSIAHEIMRFLKSIDPFDLNSPPETPLVYLKQPLNPRLSILPPTSVDDTGSFVYPKTFARQRYSSLSGSAGVATDDLRRNPVLERTKSVATAVKPLNKNDDDHRRSSLVRRSTEDGYVPPVTSSVSLTVDYLTELVVDHVRYLLSNFMIYDLFNMAAHLNLDLSVWLSKERYDAAKVSDFPAALKQLHLDFHWPYPISMSSVIEQVNHKIVKAENGGNNKDNFASTHVSIDSGIRSLNVASDSELSPETNGFDSAYHTSDADVAVRTEPPFPSLLNSNATACEKADDYVRLAVSAASVNGCTETTNTEDSWSVDPELCSQVDQDLESLEYFCGNVARGSSDSESKLCYIRKMMMGALCLDWVLLVCLVLKDLAGMAEVLSVQTLTCAGADTFSALNDGVVQLDSWSEAFCVGYKPLISAVKCHFHTVYRAMPRNEVPSSRSSSPPRIETPQSFAPAADPEPRTFPHAPPVLELSPDDGSSMTDDSASDQCYHLVNASFPVVDHCVIS